MRQGGSKNWMVSLNPRSIQLVGVVPHGYELRGQPGGFLLNRPSVCSGEPFGFPFGGRDENGLLIISQGGIKEREADVRKRGDTTRNETEYLKSHISK